MAKEQIKELIEEYYEHDFGVTKLVEKAYRLGAKEMLDTCCEYLDQHNLKLDRGHYLRHIVDGDVLIMCFYINELREKCQDIIMT